MTGDNNGRWGGEYSWPDCSDSYLDNARASILAVRSHPSLLLWCGGNELNPKGSNPNPTIQEGLSSLLSQLDPDRYFVLSSMSPQSPDPASFDVEYALAPQVSYSLVSCSRHEIILFLFLSRMDLMAFCSLINGTTSAILVFLVTNQRQFLTSLKLEVFQLLYLPV